MEGVGGKIGPDLTETNDRPHPFPGSFPKGYIGSKGGGRGEGQAWHASFSDGSILSWDTKACG